MNYAAKYVVAPLAMLSMPILGGCEKGGEPEPTKEPTVLQMSPDRITLSSGGEAANTIGIYEDEKTLILTLSGTYGTDSVAIDEKLSQDIGSKKIPLVKKNDNGISEFVINANEIYQIKTFRDGKQTSKIDLEEGTEITSMYSFGGLSDKKTIEYTQKAVSNVVGRYKFQPQ